jgi:hypothetical protein
MNVGAEPKKVAILGVLIVIGGYSFYSNVLADPTAGEPRPAPARSAVPQVAAPAAPGPSLAPPARSTAPRARGSNAEFRPSLKPRTGSDRIDPTTIDPTLRFDLLAKVQAVEAHGGRRNLFQFGAPPPPPPSNDPEPKIIPKPLAKEEAAEVTPPKPAGPPPPPPIPLKYYGYSSQQGQGRKRAFFLDGEEILVAAEGETVKRRYKIVRIGVSSVVLEDTEHKSQQTLPLTAEVVG